MALPERMRSSEKPLKRALHNMIPENEKIALEIFELILDYMGYNSEASSYRENLSAQTVLWVGINLSALRPEIFAQVTVKLKNK